jgi:adenylylsulfate kinase-like enzyme
MVILIVGKKGSGKSHYAETLKAELEKESYKVAWLDGDKFRAEKGNNDYSDEGRIKNLKDAAKEAAEYEDAGYIVLCSFIAPQKKWRNMMRKYWQVSRVVYLPGGELWPGTHFQMPSEREIETRYNYGFKDYDIEF